MKPILSCLLCATALAFSSRFAPADTARPDLRGRVLFENATPVTNATVFIYTAGPRTGSAVVCPSCYPDCGKSARTGAQGEFTIAALDPGLLFRLLVVAPGCESKFMSKTDPASGEMKITLAHLSAAKLESPTRITGMVMDAAGKALAGATVSPEGVSYGTGSSWGGTDRFVDPLAVTDEHGQFWLYCTNGVDRVHATVEGRGVAKRWVDLTPGGDHLVRMQEGVTVTGKIFRHGQPVKDVVMGLVTKERQYGAFLRGDELATDKDGFFLLPNVPPGLEFVLYAKMDSLAGGAVPMKFFTTGATGSTLKLGKLEVQPAYRVAGRVVLSDGKSVPAQTRLFLGREVAWDHTEAVLDAEGRFEFRGVPAESVGLNVRVPGYKLSKRNLSLDWLNGGLVGRVEGDIPDLVLLMEPGVWRFNGDEGDAPNGDSQPRDKPLRGIPSLVQR
ncbi:MAG TPA: carboxypeptidase-like regulatory domain-containing protein [Verrucomicrobiota bacterium]|nr:carboxypeptidase-like regulatory domain-containing protein [Verrucomicrobiota bacterium]HNT14923.1 carboxypeptidase-like regulatory domain-containing protein [Verrucomicrobiota bacterium]